MNFFKKLSGFILPREIDFFGNLCNQSAITLHITEILYHIYIVKSKTSAELNEVISGANELLTKNLIELDEVLITPVDKEAFSRAYLNLDWIVLSIKHLDVEISTYKISSLAEYEEIFGLLNSQMKVMNDCFAWLKMKKYKDVLLGLKKIVQLDDELIREYSRQLASLFNHDSVKHILRYKEILSQLKEVSKRIHVCANTMEDLVFKMN
jgi:uncharacterized protein Yka (UPF0111/DUF47 family)